MKRKIILLSLFLFIIISSFSQVSFTVKPGFNLNSGNVGYVFNRLNPYIGLQMFNLANNFENIRGIDSTKEIIRSNVYLPYLGLKYKIIDKGNISAYLNTSVFKPIYHEKYIEEGNDEQESWEEERGITEKLDIWGGELSFSAEYFFDERFSIGGEYGFRYGIVADQYENLSEDYYSVNNYLFNVTFVSLSLNFYFKNENE